MDISKRVLFFNDNHSYWLDGKQLRSVGVFLKNFFQNFDSDYWLTYKAIAHALGVDKFKKLKPRTYPTPDELNTFIKNFNTKQYNSFFNHRNDLKQQWNYKRTVSAFRGTKFHYTQEMKFHAQGYAINPWDKKEYPIQTYVDDSIADNYSQTDKLKDLKDGFYSELLVFNKKMGLAGQADMGFIETIGKTRYVDIDDFKGLPLDTKIPTKSGFKLMKDIKVGDKIFDGNGKLTKVKHVSKVHHNPCYKIRFDTNDEITADHEHKWIVTKRDRYTGYHDIEMTTEEIANYYKTKYTGKNGNAKLMIKCVSIKLPKIDLPLDPYILGMWLADGNRTAGTICNPDQRVWDEIKKRGYTLSMDYSRNDDKKCRTHTVYGIVTQLRKLNLLKNKHIPDIYLRSSHEQRLDLLRGFMDGDGYFNRSRNRCVMVTSRKKQAYWTMELVSSLGMKPTIIPAKTSGFNKNNIPTWHVTFSPDESPFLVRNTDYEDIINKIPNRNRIRSKSRYIVSVEKVDTISTKCIAVESPDRTYLFSENYIKTHNTNEKKPPQSGFQKAHYPIDNLYDCNHNKYQIQISAYAYMMELAGFTPRNLSYTWIKDYNIDSAIRVPVVYLRDQIIAMYEMITKFN